MELVFFLFAISATQSKMYSGTASSFHGLELAYGAIHSVDRSMLKPIGKTVIFAQPRIWAVASLHGGKQETRDEVKAEVMKAPKRRVDNMITRLTDSLHLLQVHTRVSFVDLKRQLF